MPRKLVLKPMELPRGSVLHGGHRIQPLPRGEQTQNTDGFEHPFDIGDTERFLFSHFAHEQIQISGTPCDLFSQKIDKATRDPLYDEPTERVWSKAFKIKCWVSWASSTPVTGEEGFRLAFRTQCWIPRAEIERAGCPAPVEGDIIRFWNIPFFNETAVAGEQIKNAGYFFDIINADNDGHINDTASFTGFRCDLVRRSEFGAERRILPP